MAQEGFASHEPSEREPIRGPGRKLGGPDSEDRRTECGAGAGRHRQPGVVIGCDNLSGAGHRIAPQVSGNPSGQGVLDCSARQMSGNTSAMPWRRSSS
jgi:hypothetical protein